MSVLVITEPAAAAAALHPIRARVLAALAEPASAAMVADRLGLARQKVNYHLRALEAHGLVRVVEERTHGGLTERILTASADSFAISPAALGAVAADPGRVGDRLSASYLIALGARIVREVGGLVRSADDAGQTLPTLSIDTSVRFRSASERAAFTDQMTAAVTDLVARYHDEHAPGGRRYRVLLGAHPEPDPDTIEEQP